MPKLKQEDLLKIQQKYQELLNNPNQVNQLFNEIPNEIPSNMVSDKQQKIAIVDSLPIVLAKIELENKDTVPTDTFFMDMQIKMKKAYGMDYPQMEQVILNRNKLDKISSISDFGDVQKLDYDDMDFENDSLMYDNQNEPAVENKGPKQSAQFSKRPIEVYEETNTRREYDSIIKDVINKTAKDDPDKSVYFNYEFFNGLLEEKDTMIERIKDHNGDIKYGDVFSDVVKSLETSNNSEMSKEEAASFDAKERIGTYMQLNRRSKERTIGDIFKSPIQTFKEWRTKRNLESDIQKRYGINKETLEKMESMVFDTTYKKEGGYEKMDTDFVCMGTDGKKVSVNSSLDFIQSFANERYPKDPNYEVRLENERKEDMLKNVMNDTQVFAPKKEEKSQSVDNNAPGMFISNGVIKNVTEIDNSQKAKGLE